MREKAERVRDGLSVLLGLYEDVEISVDPLAMYAGSPECREDGPESEEMVGVGWMWHARYACWYVIV